VGDDGMTDGGICFIGGGQYDLVIELMFLNLMSRCSQVTIIYYYLKLKSISMRHHRQVTERVLCMVRPKSPQPKRGIGFYIRYEYMYQKDIRLNNSNPKERAMEQIHTYEPGPSFLNMPSPNQKRQPNYTTSPSYASHPHSNSSGGVCSDGDSNLIVLLGVPGP